MVTVQGEVRVAPASVLERRLDEVLAVYEESLLASGSSHLGDTRRAALRVTEARRLLVHVIAELRCGTCLPHGTDSLKGEALDPDGRVTHPVESGRASAALFDAVTVVLLDEPEQTRPSPAAFSVLLSLLHHQIVARHSALSVAHSGYLLERVHSARDDERRCVARELHDEVAGHLGSALNWLELYDFYRDTQPELAREKAAAARDIVRASLARLREVMSGLRQHADTGSLRAALAADLDATGDEQSADVRISVTGDEAWLPPLVAEELLLIAREAQRNALRHAKATVINVAVHLEPGEARAVVEDDGVGFDAKAPVPCGHGGMLSMRERAELLGGDVLVESQPGCGTRVLVFVPFKGEKGGSEI